MMKILAFQSELSVIIIPEAHEYSEEILAGRKSTLTAKRYDILFSSWNYSQPFQFGVEAKLLIEKRLGK